MKKRVKGPSSLPKHKRALLPVPTRCQSLNKDGSKCRGYGTPPGASTCLTHSEDPDVVKAREEARDRQRVSKTPRPFILALDPEEIPKIDFSTQKKVENFCQWLAGIILEGRVASSLAAQVLNAVKVSLMSREIAIGEELARLEKMIIEREGT